MSESPYRKVLSMAVGVLAQNAGFSNIDALALDTLTQMMHSFISETGRSGRAFCELGGRTSPLPADVLVAVMEMGINTVQLHEHMANMNSHHATPCIVLPIPKHSQPTAPTSPLATSESRRAFDFAPWFAPPLPPPHTYERTEVTAQPSSDYASVREAAAVQRREVNTALVEYMLKTNETVDLFPGESLGMLLAPEPESRPYIAGLVQSNDIQSIDQSNTQ